jgi:histidyl-tRNA synthetase
MGIERLMMVLNSQNTEMPEDERCDIYLASMGDKASVFNTKLASLLRAEGFSVETDIVGRSLKAQMKYADKIGAKYSVVIGDNEIENKKAVLKNMSTGEAIEVELCDGLIKAVYENMTACALDNLFDAAEKM